MAASFGRPYLRAGARGQFSIHTSALTSTSKGKN
jgi:hypothetical protein